MLSNRQLDVSYRTSGSLSSALLPCTKATISDKEIEMKECNKCHKLKEETEFYRAKSNKPRRTLTCKDCVNSAFKLWAKTPKGLVSSMMRAQRSSSKKRGHLPPSYSFDELMAWLTSHPKFDEYYKAWEDSGYLKQLRPSIDRLDDYKGYSFDNIQLLSWEENLNKSHKDRRQGNNNKRNESIIQRKMDGKAVAVYYSIQSAARATNVHATHICKCCKGLLEHTDNFKWEYLAEDLNNLFKTKGKNK